MLRRALHYPPGRTTHLPSPGDLFGRLPACRRLTTCCSLRNIRFRLATAAPFALDRVAPYLSGLDVDTPWTNTSGDALTGVERQIGPAQVPHCRTARHRPDLCGHRQHHIGSAHGRSTAAVTIHIRVFVFMCPAALARARCSMST